MRLHPRELRLPAAALTLAGVAFLAPPATAASSWQQYVVGPTSRDVHPVRVLSATGDVTNPSGLLGGGVTTLRRPAPPAKTAWPAGTTATASSSHDPNNGNDGNRRTYDAANAIDGDTDTFWNDDTIAAYPDVLTLTTPSAVTEDGITVRFNADGVPQDFTVQSADGATLATVTGNSLPQLAVRFPRPVTTTQFRITVTRDQSTGKGEFTRINEVWPGLVADPVAPSVVVDFGKVVVGYPKLAFAGASANRPGVRLSFAESQQYLGDRSDFTRSDFAGGPGTDQHAVPTGVSTWTDTKGCLADGKVCADGLHGFRYVKITLDALPGDAPDAQPDGEVDISGVTLDFTGYIGRYTGWFESSDQQLNQYWYDAAYTNELVIDTFRPTDIEPRGADSPTLDGKLVLHDGAKRDRDPYVGDIAVSGRTTYLTHDAAVAARDVLADLAEHQRADGWIPPASINNYTLPLFDYPLWWVTASWDYVLYTGDTAYGAQYYAQLVKVLDGWYPSVTDARGLLSRPSGYGDYAFLPRDGEVTYYNALYVQALKDAGQLAKSLGHNADASRWQQRATAVSAAVNANLWDGAAYVDAAGGTRHGQDGNGIAIVAGVADRTRATQSLNYLAAHTTLPYGNSFMDDNSLVSDGTQRVYAFTSYPEIEARFLTGQPNSAIDEIKRLYGWMAGHDPGPTDWEGIGAGGSLYEGAYTSAAHGWSTGVLPALTNDLLGATPTSPGFATWTVAPHPGSVAWARGQLPTPHGPLGVSWRQSNGSITITVDAPPGTHGTIRFGNRDVAIGGGHHTLTVR
ncbi:MAG TPA: alpha-L-rhamnosidase C-terminal domain-containing protein [Kutzneria sp.]|jgi:hypothetical protein